MNDLELLENLRETLNSHSHTRHVWAQGRAAFLASIPLALVQILGLTFLSPKEIYTQVLLYSGAASAGIGGLIAGSAAIYRYFIGLKEAKRLKYFKNLICARQNQPKNAYNFNNSLQNIRDTANRMQLTQARECKDFINNTMPFLLVTGPAAVLSLMGADSLAYASVPGSGFWGFICFSFGVLFSAASSTILGVSGYLKVKTNTTRKIYECAADLLSEYEKASKNIFETNRPNSQPAEYLTGEKSAMIECKQNQEPSASSPCGSFFKPDKPQGGSMERMRPLRRKHFELTL